MHLKAKKRFGRTSLARASGVRPLAFSHTATGPSCAAGQLSDADSTMFGVLDSKIRSRRQFSSNTPVTLKVRDLNITVPISISVSGLIQEDIFLT